VARLRLLYLGFAFPPGIHAQFPDFNTAGHDWETSFSNELRKHLEIRYAGTMAFPLPPPPAKADPASGIPHDLTLVEEKPRWWMDWKAAQKLKATVLQWEEDGWVPDALLVYNFTPIYNHFTRWFKKVFPEVPRVLFLLDSAQLGETIPPGKRLRYRLKPMVVLDETMLDEFTACIGLSRDARDYFAPRNVPFFWLPGGCTTPPGPTREFLPPRTGRKLRFGYFGSLSDHAGAWRLAQTFARSTLDHEFHLTGPGKNPEKFVELARRDSRIHFHGFLEADNVLPFGRSCDVLVNPRLPGFGNRNCFPSKLFNYAMCARSIISTRLSGVDEVIGPEGFYVGTGDFDRELDRCLASVAQLDRAELDRHGRAIYERIRTGYDWATQAAGAAQFLEQVVTNTRQAL